MKIEMGESLMLSWAKHVQGCQIATLNWKPSNTWDFYNQEEVAQIMQKLKDGFTEDIFKKSNAKQVILQAELDVLGLKIENSVIKDVFAIDIAFHENGLLYSDNMQKITSKMLRAALVLYSIFNLKSGNIIFASPKVQPNCIDLLKERTELVQQIMNNLGFNFKFSFICNQDFYEQILLPVQEKSRCVSDTSDLFMRCLQMWSLFTKETKAKNSEHSVSNGNRQAGASSDYNANLVAFCFSCGHEVLYPHLTQSEAFEKAAAILGIKTNTLRNLRDYFDRYNPKSQRVGWDAELTDLRKEIIDKYLNNVSAAYEEAKIILKIK